MAGQRFIIPQSVLDEHGINLEDDVAVSSLLANTTYVPGFLYLGDAVLTPEAVVPNDAFEYVTRFPTLYAPTALIIEVPDETAGIPVPTDTMPYHYSWSISHATKISPTYSEEVIPTNALMTNRNLWYTEGAYGNIPIHEPGTYTLIGRRTRGNVVDIITREIVVPEISANTNVHRYVSANPDYTGITTEPNAKFVTAITDAFTGGNLDNKVVHLRRGETYYVSGSTNVDARSYAGLATQIRAFGDEALPDPIIELENGFLWFRGVGSVSLTGVDVKGQWSSDTETLGAGLTSHNSGILAVVPIYIGDCKLRKMFNGITTAASSNIDIAVANSVFSENQRYQYFADENTAISLNGCNGYQPILGLGGGTGKDDLGDRHGMGRHTGNRPSGWFQCMGFNNAGWTINAGPDNNLHPAHQALLRYNSLGLVNGSFFMERCILEGGAEMLSLFASGGVNAGTRGGGNTPQNIVIRNTNLYGTANTRKHILAGHTGIHVINCSITAVDAPPEFGLSSFVGLGDDLAAGTVSFGLDQGITFHNCAFNDLRSPANGGTSMLPIFDPDYATEGYTNVSSSNHTLYGPNLTTPEIADGPFDTATYNPTKYSGLRHKNLQDNAGSFDDSSFATTTDMSLFIPENNAGAATGGISPVPFSDIFGNAKANNAVRGPYNLKQ